MKKKQKIGLLEGVLAIMLFALGSVLAKILLKDISPEVLITLREGLAVIFILFIFGVKLEIKKILNFKPKTIIALIIFSVLVGAAEPFLFLKGLSSTPATDAILITSMSGIATSILASLFLKDKFSLEKIIGTFFMLAGVLIITTQGFANGLHFGFGYYFLFGSVLAVAIATIIFKKYLTQLSSDILLFSANFWGLIFILGLTPLFIDVNYDLSGLWANKQTLLLLIGYAILVLLFANFLWYKSLEKVKASITSLLTFQKPLYGVIFAVIILNEIFYNFHFLGATLILGGMIFAMFHRRKHYSSSRQKKHLQTHHWKHF